MNKKIFIIDSLPNIDKVCREILSNFNLHRVFALYGELGSGKTTLIKSFCSQLGATKGIKSPTFALLHTYFTDKDEPIYHFDCYRIEKIQEIIDIGFFEYLNSGNYCFIEWADKIEQLLPSDIVKLKINVDEQNNQRIITII